MLRNVKYMSETLKNRLELLILKGKIFSNDSMLFTVKKKNRTEKGRLPSPVGCDRAFIWGTSVNFLESLFALF